MYLTSYISRKNVKKGTKNELCKMREEILNF